MTTVPNRLLHEVQEQDLSGQWSSLGGLITIHRMLQGLISKEESFIDIH